MKGKRVVVSEKTITQSAVGCLLFPLALLCSHQDRTEHRNVMGKALMHVTLTPQSSKHL